jgi:gas vesicle protein
MRSSKTEAGLSLLGGALLGAAAMYLLDPESGRRRREHLGEMAEDKLGPAWDTARAASAALAEKAGDFSAHLSDRAHDFATNVSSRAGDAADAIGDSGSGLFDTLRHFGRRTVSRASDAASSAADYASGFGSDLAERARRQSHAARHRLAKAIDPEHVRGTGHAVGWTTAGFGTLMLGAGLMYVLDPERGRGRRAWLGQKTTSILNDCGTMFRRTGRDLMNRARGTMYEARGGLQNLRGSSGDADGERLLQRVRSEIGHVVTYPTAIQLMADANGTVTVYGRVPSSEEDRLLSCIHAVPGVREIINRVEVCSPEDFAGSYRAGGSSYATGSNPGSGTSGYSVPPM